MKTLLLATDKELVHKFKNGETAALEMLLHRHKDTIFSAILFLLKDKYKAENVFEETFIKIIDSIRQDKYDESTPFVNNAIRIAHNVSLDQLKKVQRLAIETTTYDAEYSIEDNIAEFPTSDEVRQLLEILSDDEREVIALRHFADIDFTEIGKTKNLSKNSVLCLMSAALTNVLGATTGRQVGV